jgi:hypothetical protein
MTIASSIITSAFREGNLIAIGASPTAAMQTEALERLNRLVQSLYGSEMGENLVDFLVPAPQRTAAVAANFPQLPIASDPSGSVYPYPPKNSRIVWGNVTTTVYFPEAPEDGSRMALISGSGAGDSGSAGKTLTIDGNGKLINGAATGTFLSPQATQTQWLFRADTGNWTPVVDMAASDQMPFPSELDDLFICLLSIRMAPRFTKTPAQDTKDTALRMLKTFKARYRQSAPALYGSI